MSEVWILTEEEWHEDSPGEEIIDVYASEEAARKAITEWRDSRLSEMARQIDRHIDQINKRLENGDAAPNRAKEKLDSLEFDRRRLVERFEIRDGEDNNKRRTIGYGGMYKAQVTLWAVRE